MCAAAPQNSAGGGETYVGGNCGKAAGGYTRGSSVRCYTQERSQRRGASVGRHTQQIQVTPRHQLGVVASRDVQALYDVDVIVS